MKKIIFIIIVVFIANSFYAQAVFDKFNGQDEVAAVVANKKMFELMSKVKVNPSDKEAQQYLNLIKKLDDLRSFTTTNAKTANDMKMTAENYIKTSGLNELTQVNEEGRTVKIFVKRDADNTQLKEFLMFIDSDSNTNETVLMSLTGDFKLNEIPVLTDKMKISGGDLLKRIISGMK